MFRLPFRLWLEVAMTKDYQYELILRNTVTEWQILPLHQMLYLYF